MNRSSWEGVRSIRDLLESWFSRYPKGHPADLRGRFRSADDSNHRSAFFELFLHEVLYRLACHPLVHPTGLGPLRNDLTS